MKRLLLAALLAFPTLAAARTPPTDAERGTPIVPGPARPFQVPPLEEGALKSGMKLALQQMSRLPIVSVRLILPYGGSAFEPSGKTGLAGVVASLMSEGTRNLPGVRFTEKVEELGAQLSMDVQADAMTATLFTTKENLDKALALMAAMVREPSLPDPDFQRIQQETLVGLENEKGDPGALAERRLGARVFNGHPYGRSPDAATVASISIDDVRAFHASHVRPEGAILAVSGDVALPELQALAAKHFGAWKAAGGAGALPDEVPAVAETDASAPAAGMAIDVIDMPGSQQSAIRVGHRSISRDAPDYFAVAVMNYILGQMPITGRLEHNIREVHNWAYGARSEIEALKKGGVFSASADVQTDATAPALQEMLKEFQALRDTPVPAGELEGVKRFMAGSFVLRQQTVQTIAAQVGGIELHGLSKDTLAKYRERVLAVTAAQVQAAARAHLRAGDLQVVIAGDAARVRGELGKIAPVKVYGTDGRPKPAPARTPEGPNS